MLIFLTGNSDSSEKSMSKELIKIGDSQYKYNGLYKYCQYKSYKNNPIHIKVCLNLPVQLFANFRIRRPHLSGTICFGELTFNPVNMFC